MLNIYVLAVVTEIMGAVNTFGSVNDLRRLIVEYMETPI